LVLTINHNRYIEWECLFNYLCEYRDELEKKDRMRALVLCLQRHWQDVVNEIPEWF
jgi:hypothetical protein